MTTEMNPSPNTGAVETNPAEKPGTPDVSPVGPSTVKPDTASDTGCCTTPKSSSTAGDAGTLASSEKDGKPAVPGTN